MGIESTIIPLVWEQNSIDDEVSTIVNTGPSSSNFESKARILRYRALGHACKTKDITFLVVGHHADDQAETILMRLMSKRWRSGLIGMQPVQTLPECEGEYGLYNSGNPICLPTGPPILVEDGGIQLLRPLLQFDKSRLIATCKNNGIFWAEDETNHEPELTPRNSVRHVMQHYKLPAALSKKSLISLSVTMRERVEFHKEMAEDLFDKCPIKLDIQVGYLIARFPPASSFLSSPILTASHKHQARNTAIIFLSRIAQLISVPSSGVSIGKLSVAVDFIYPELLIDPTVEVQQSEFNAYGLFFQRWKKPSPFASPETPAEKHDKEWMIYQQRDMRHAKKLDIWIPSLHDDPTAGDRWHLFGGRYWVKVKNHDKSPLLICFFDTERFRNLEKESQNSVVAENSDTSPSRFINAALQLVRPKNLHQHLICISRINENGEKVLVSLPTLNVAMDDASSEGFRSPEVEVRYKNIDTGRRLLEEIIAPGITEDQILATVERLWGKKKQKETQEENVETRQNTSESMEMGEVKSKKIKEKKQGAERVGMEIRTGIVSSDQQSLDPHKMDEAYQKTVPSKQQPFSLAKSSGVKEPDVLAREPPFSNVSTPAKAHKATATKLEEFKLKLREAGYDPDAMFISTNSPVDLGARTPVQEVNLHQIKSDQMSHESSHKDLFPSFRRPSVIQKRKH